MPPEVQAFFEGLSVWTVIVWIAGLLAVAGFVIKHVWPLVTGLSNFLDDMKGEEARPGVPARPGIMARLASIEQKQITQGDVLEVVRHEMFPNSGKSLRDQTNRMEEKLDRDNARIEELGEQLEEHIEQSAVILKNLPKE